MSHAHRRHAHHKRVPEPQPQVFKTVFYTAPASFKGKIAGYSTILGGGNKNPPTKKTTSTTPTRVTKTTPKITSSSKTTFKSVPTSTKKKTTKLVDEDDEDDKDDKEKDKDEEEENKDRSFTSSTIKLKETSTTSDDAFAATRDASLSDITTSAVPTVEAKSGGMSGGATAGLVAGIIAIILVGLAFVAFLYRKKQQKRMQEAYGKPEDEKKAAPVRQVTNFDEKDPSPFADQLPQHQEPPHSATSFGSSVTAPRVSYRPGSEFAPNFATGAAAGAALSTANGRLNPAAVPANKPQQQEIVRKPAPQPLALQQSNFEPQQPQQQQPQPAYVAFVPGAQNSPSSSTFSGDAPGTPVAGGAAGQPLMLVFRVTMDFKPSMADELELRTGDLVRLMHEYDDGWALCSKMDRSQQGVCPRTCLSQKPVKPRPKNAPGPPGPRGPPRQNGPPGRPQTPQSRPQTPQGMQSRPQTPNGQRGNATPQHSPPRVHIIPEITVSPVDDSPPVSLSKPYPDERQRSPLANN